MKADVYNQDGLLIGDTALSDTVFAMPLKHDLVHQALIAQESHARVAIAHTKDRSEVRGGGKKPWKQKGTGRARHASIRSPIWKGGGITFGPTKDRVFTKKINRKMRLKALCMVLSSKIKDRELVIIDGIDLTMTKTKQAAHIVTAVRQKVDPTSKKKDSLLLVVPQDGLQIQRAIANIPRVDICTARNMNVTDVLRHKHILVTKQALPAIEQLCAY